MRIQCVHNTWIDQRGCVRVAPGKFARPCALRDIIDLQSKMSTTLPPPSPPSPTRPLVEELRHFFTEGV